MGEVRAIFHEVSNKHHTPRVILLLWREEMPGRRPDSVFVSIDAIPRHDLVRSRFISHAFRVTCILEGRY